MLSLRTQGVNRVQNKLRKLIAADKEKIDPVVRKWSQETRAELKATKSPSRLPHFKHQRTGRQANSWSVKRVDYGVYDIQNSATNRGFPYPVVVVGNARGQRIGRAKHPSFARWWTARQIIEERIPSLRRQLVDKLTEDF